MAKVRTPEQRKAEKRANMKISAKITRWPKAHWANITEPHVCALKIFGVLAPDPPTPKSIFIQSNDPDLHIVFPLTQIPGVVYTKLNVVRANASNVTFEEFANLAKTFYNRPLTKPLFDRFCKDSLRKWSPSMKLSYLIRNHRSVFQVDFDEQHKLVVVALF
jgi:hypothetical protein